MPNDNALELKPPAVTEDDVQQAIRMISECRQTHVDWAGWQGDNQDWRDHVKPDAPGTPEHHREWIANYDLVLRVLGLFSECFEEYVYGTPPSFREAQDHIYGERGLPEPPDSSLFRPPASLPGRAHSLGAGGSAG